MRVISLVSRSFYLGAAYGLVIVGLHLLFGWSVEPDGVVLMFIFGADCLWRWWDSLLGGRKWMAVVVLELWIAYVVGVLATYVTLIVLL